jgi:uncharacterized protein with GYD domain
MPKYLVEGSYTREGVAGVMAKGGSSRRDAAAETVATLGGRLECLYFAFGDRDVILIVDVPDDEAAAAVSMAVNASGAVVIKTTPLLTPEQLDAAAKRSVEYRPPGS